MPMPNATVAAMMRAGPSRNAVIASRAARARKPSVVERHPLACRRERVVCRLRAGVRRGIHDPRARELARRVHELALLLSRDRARVVRRQMDMRPVEVADHHLGIAQAEPPDDLLRTGGAAVAVKATRTGAPSASACAPSSM